MLSSIKFFGGSGWVSGIGRRVVAKYSMGNQTNSKFVEENDRKESLHS